MSGLYGGRLQICFTIAFFLLRNLILKQDEGVDIAVEIISEIAELAWTIVHEHMIEEQCFAFACNQATEEMLQIVEWHYLSRDDGEVNTATDSSWNEDTGMMHISIYAVTHMHLILGLDCRPP